MIAPSDEHAQAHRLAHEAGQLLLELRRGFAGDDAELRAEGDRRSHEFLIAGLRAAFPGDPILSEEGVDDQSRHGARRTWIIDPLDGTREFGERDRWDWAVHVALAIDGTPSLGAVAMPARAMTLSTAAPPYLGPRDPRPLRIAVSRTRAPEIISGVTERLGATTVPMGSAGAKVGAVLLGEADAYIHAGGQWEWDSAAPVAVALAAGLHASRLDGRPLVYNQARPWLPDLLVCRAELAWVILLATFEAGVASADG